MLVPDCDHTMLPAVKVSNHLLSAEAWATLQGQVAAACAGDDSQVPRDWAQAKSWMGPDVSSEEQFSTFQKLFFGIVSLRQRLQRRCSPMADELRYSQVPGKPRDMHMCAFEL